LKQTTAPKDALCSGWWVTRASPRGAVKNTLNALVLPFGLTVGCDTHQTVTLDIARRPKTTPVHELERYMRCRQCSEVRGYPYKR
jgi:hypothetical protein